MNNRAAYILRILTSTNKVRLFIEPSLLLLLRGPLSFLWGDQIAKGCEEVEYSHSFISTGNWFQVPHRHQNPRMLKSFEMFTLSHLLVTYNTQCNVNVMSVQFSSVAQSCPTLCDPMNRSTPGLPVHHQLPEFTETHIHRVSDAIQPSHPLSSPSPAPNPSQHQSLFQWVNSSHEVAKVLEFQL